MAKVSSWATWTALALGAAVLTGCASTGGSPSRAVTYAESCEQPDRDLGSRFSCSGFAATALSDRNANAIPSREMGAAYVVPKSESVCPDVSRSLAERASCGGYAQLPLAERR